MRKVALFEDAAAANTGSIIERLLQAMRPQTRVVGLTWVHSATGMRLPIREIAAALKAKYPEVLLVLDGVHGIGAADETIATMGADYVCAGCHKWMFAPRGTGLVWADARNWARLRPVVPTFSDMESYNAWMEDREPRTANNAARMTPGGFHAFEHQWAMSAAFAMHEAMGRARVAARIRSLNDQLKASLAGNRKVRVHTPMSGDLSAGLVAFEVAGLSPEEVVKRLLERRIIASTSPYAVSYARLAPSLVNTPEEVERAASAVHALAG
jgi:selenocysteine lyase/cysteine desulfurase